MSMDTASIIAPNQFKTTKNTPLKAVFLEISSKIKVNMINKRLILAHLAVLLMAYMTTSTYMLKSTMEPTDVNGMEFA
jgi:hypothetical protein